jgi:hypothetical protein
MKPLPVPLLTLHASPSTLTAGEVFLKETDELIAILFTSMGTAKKSKER